MNVFVRIVRREKNRDAGSLANVSMVFRRWMRYATLTATPGVGLHAGGTASAGELSQTPYVHFGDSQRGPRIDS
jgi:hypothetical protein